LPLQLVKDKDCFVVPPRSDVIPVIASEAKLSKSGL